MISVLFGGFLIVSCLNNQALASLITCPTITTTATSIRYIMTLSSSKMASYSGTLLLSSDGNFIFDITIPNSGSPQSTVKGTWSFSDDTNALTLNSQTLYFFDVPKFSVNSLTCTYTCGTDDNALRTCTVTYTLKSSEASGKYSLPLDLSILE